MDARELALDVHAAQLARATLAHLLGALHLQNGLVLVQLARVEAVQLELRMQLAQALEGGAVEANIRYMDTPLVQRGFRLAQPFDAFATHQYLI